MEQKEALRAQFDAASAQAPIPMSSLPTDADWTALRYRPVVATGEYDARRQVLVDNRVHEDAPAITWSRRSCWPTDGPCSSTVAGLRRARRAPRRQR